MPAHDLAAAISAFGAAALSKLKNLAARGEPEDQLRAPLEHLIGDVAELCGFSRTNVVAVGESSLAHLKTRPDYAVTLRRALVGFIEVKAPGKGADPRKFRDTHDKEQWLRLQSLPNLMYTDGNEFTLWHSGDLQLVVRLEGGIETAGANLTAPQNLLTLFDDFFRWEPLPPRNPKMLAEMTARVCRLLRDEVTEQLAEGDVALCALAADWRRLLFPDADDATFADGYAQAVTFGLLVARAQGIELATGLDQAAKKLGTTHSLIGAALRILTDDATSHDTLKTSIGTLTRVLDVVDWPTISKGDARAWLYFYEDFLAVYDNTLRKQTGSYYTPPEVVSAMTDLVDEALRTRFGRRLGLADQAVTLVDPAVGTGTFILGVLHRISETVAADQGEGAVPGMIDAALQRLFAFEIQLGPFAVAQLRILAELADLHVTPSTPLRMYVTDTLGNPYVEDEQLGAMYAPIAESRRKANEVKKTEPIMVVIGNPPYKEKAKGRGGWVENGDPDAKVASLLADWMPPTSWGVGPHLKHLRNLYVYFWRWATWKVFDHDTQNNSGIVAFITVAGFLNGPGFERMRDYLRRTCDEVFVIHCSPEGHQPEVATRIFEGVQQPICIVIAVRTPASDPDVPATVRFRSLPEGLRTEKFAALGATGLSDDGWVPCSTAWRAPFLPASSADWSSYPAIDELFIYNGSGVMPGRTWVIAPDAETLGKRWDTLLRAPEDKKDLLFHPHEGGDRSVAKRVKTALPGFSTGTGPVGEEKGPVVSPVRYGFRSFDRQWIIPDNRLINRPNPNLWRAHSNQQVYLTALERTSPTSGPGVTLTANIPDLDHYSARGGRAFPLWLDSAGTVANIPPGLLAVLQQRLGVAVTAPDVLAYVVALTGHPAYASRFEEELKQPGLRVPVTADGSLFAESVQLGRRVAWLHTFGERYIEPAEGRPAGPPRLTSDKAPRVPPTGTIPSNPDAMPDTIDHDASERRLLIGSGYVDEVTSAMWSYEVSGKHVLRQWFSYRKRDRERPIIGDRRPPSALGNIQPDHWLAEYTTDLLDLLNVLGLLVEFEAAQADLLDRICDAPLITRDELDTAVAFTLPDGYPKKPTDIHTPAQPTLLGD